MRGTAQVSRRSSMKFFLIIALLLGAAPLLAQPADKPASPKATKRIVRVSGTAFLRVLHAIPNGPAVDVYAGTAKVASNAQFKTLGDYVSVSSGKSALKVVVAGQSEPALVSEEKSLTKGKYFTLVITGKQAPSLLLVNDSAGKGIADKARVRVVHAAPGVPDVLVTVPSARTASGYANLLANPLGYGTTASKSVKPTTTSIQIRGLDGHLIKEVSGIELQAGHRYDAFALGALGSTFDVLVKPAATQ